MPSLLMTASNYILLLILIILILIWLGWILYTHIKIKKIATFLNDDQFEAGKRKAQIIDLREKKTFNAGHILGARNVPYSTFRRFYNGIRSDLPVYLYDEGTTLSTRACFFLNKKGYHKLFILKSGYRNWNGKTKKRDA